MLAAVGGTAFGQAAAPPAAQPPKTQWAPITQAPAVPLPPPLPLVPAAPISTQPGLVPKTLTFQKTAGDTAPGVPATPLTFQKNAGDTTLPPVGVPAQPTAMARQEQPPKKVDDTGREPVPKAADRQPELTRGTLPTKANVFRLTSDVDLNNRIQKELDNRRDPFPEAAPLSQEGLVYKPKTLTYPAMVRFREPNYVVHRRLYFEEPNSERYGWELGFLQPFVSSAYFVKDVVFWPHNIASGVWKNRFETSAGRCYPGSPTPYYLYPPGFTVSGLMLESTLITGLVFIFP